MAAATDIESAVFGFLAANSAITNLLGAKSEAGIYPMRAKKDAVMPFVVTHRIASMTTHTKDGDMNLTHSRFQFTCWAAKYAEAKAVIAQVRAAFKGVSPGGQLNGFTVSQVVVEDDGRDLSDLGTEEFGFAVDVLFIHQEN